MALGCGGACGCGGGCSEPAGPPMGNFGAFGYAMAPDGVPISLDLPGYEAVTGSTPGFNAPGDGALTPGVTGSGLDTKLFGCPVWIWAVAAGLVLFDRRGR